MAASLRNFFITFVLALAIFGGLAFYYYGDLVALLPQSGSGDVSSDVSADSSAAPEQNVSGGEIYIDDPSEGDGLGILHGLIVTKDESGEAISAKFIRINSEKRIVVTCDLSMSAELYNDVGALVPLRDYFRIYSGETASAAVCALTGYAADFYLELTPDSLENLVANMLEPHYLVLQEINYVNPKYADVEYAPGAALPTDYYKYLPAGEVTLTADNLAILREHYGTCDGSDGHLSYSTVLADLYDTLLEQLFTEQRLFMENDTARFAAALSGAETNLTESFLKEKAKLLMKYRDTAYQTVKVTYTTRDATLYNFKTADQ